MKKRLINLLANSRLVSTFMASPSPKWAVLIADLFAVFISACLQHIFGSSNIPLAYAANPMFSGVAQVIIVVAVYAIFSSILKTNQYVLRLSVIEDIYRIVMLIIVASITLVAGSLVSSIWLGFRYFSIWGIFTVGMFSFAIMMVVRLIIKYIYTAITSIDREKKRVIVLGSAINSFYLASALKTEAGGRFIPVALLSLSEQKQDSTVNSIPIIKFDPETVADVFKRYRADTLIFLSTQIELIRDRLADVFLSNNISMLMLNQVEEFNVNDDSMPNISAHVHDIKIEDLLGRDPIKTDSSAIRSVITNQVVLITGAAGSIGSEIVNQVAALGAREIVLVDQAETPMHDLQLQMEAKHPEVTIRLFIGDVVNRPRMEQAFATYKPRYVFHAAAYKHVPMMERNPVEAIMTNVFGTKNIADLSNEYNVEKFVMVSTDKAVNPTNVMGASKRIAEIYVQSLFFHLRQTSDRRTTQYITTRFGNVLGSNGSVIPLFRRQIEEGGPLTVTHRDIIRYFMTIPEACSLVLEAGCMGRGGEIYIFDMGQPVKIYDLACRMISLAGLKLGRDIDIIETGLRPGEKLYEELLNDKERTMSTQHKKIMIAKVREYNYNDVIRHLELLEKCVKSGVNHDIVAEMKHIVPEFKSQNSEFEKIDIEIKEEITSGTAEVDSLATIK